MCLCLASAWPGLAGLFGFFSDHDFGTRGHPLRFSCAWPALPGLHCLVSRDMSVAQRDHLDSLGTVPVLEKLPRCHW